MPLFSVIIPTHGRSTLLADAVDSVLAQSVQDFELIIVDDGSPEPVRVTEDTRIRLLRIESNGGPARARNLGVEASTGEILAFLDDDDVWVPERLSFAVEGLKRAPVAVCWQSPHGGRILEGDVRDSILNSTTPHLGATALLRSAWVPLDETYRTCEDLVWWLAASRGSRLTTHPEQGLVVRRHEGPRVGYGAEQRIRDSHRLLSEYSEYFAQHRRAAAFRWKRIGLMNLELGRRGKARKAFARAILCHPDPADIWHLAFPHTRSL